MSSSCCPDSSWGPLASLDYNNYEPKGKEEVLDVEDEDGDVNNDSSLLIYYSPPSQKESDQAKNVIIVFTDVYSFSNRMKFICDTIADNGYHVIMPDCLKGETKETNPDVAKWLRKYPIQSVMKDIKLCQQYIKSKFINVNELDLNYSSIGFCWGGWAIAKSKSEGMDWKCAVSPHPSTKIENFVFGDDEESMLEKVDMPFLLLPAGNDRDNLKTGSQVVEHLKVYGGDSILFENMVHGWVTRGDLSQDDVREDANKALKFALDFIDKNVRS